MEYILTILSPVHVLADWWIRSNTAYFYKVGLVPIKSE